MRRLAVGVVLGVLLAVPIAHSGGGPKDLTVANLHATENIDSVGGITGGGFCNWVDYPNNCVSWIAGTIDPRGQYQASAGSFYTRRIGATYPGTSGELWFKTGATASDWTCVAGCAP